MSPAALVLGLVVLAGAGLGFAALGGVAGLVLVVLVVAGAVVLLYRWAAWR